MIAGVSLQRAMSMNTNLNLSMTGRKQEGGRTKDMFN